MRKHPPPQKHALTLAESLLLDLVRISAALVVAFGHLTQAPFSSGTRDLTALARSAVAIFFFLSGFVIRYVTCRRRGTLAGFLGDRASRIYSVALPAMLVTFLADMLARRANPSFFAHWAPGAAHPLGHMAENLLWTAQLWFRNVSALSDLPFWSLNYEVIYYLLYACYFYLSGRSRWLLAAALALAAGPRILLLFPLWLAGCYAYDLYYRSRAGVARTLNRLLLASIAVGFVAAGLVRFLPQFRRMVSASKAGFFTLMGQNFTLGNYLFGLLFAVLLLRLLVVARSTSFAPDVRTVGILRYIAEGTFPIYLLHFPLYVLIGACVPYNHGSWPQRILIFAAVAAVGILLGPFCNWLKCRFRELQPRHSSERAPAMASN